MDPIALGAHYAKYLNGAFVCETAHLISVEDEGSWAVVTYGKARTTRGFFLLPAGTECWLQLDVGCAKFMLFDDENCAVTLAEVPLAAVLAPELGILHRDEAIRNERMRLKASPARMIGWEEYEDCAPPRLPGS